MGLHSFVSDGEVHNLRDNGEQLLRLNVCVNNKGVKFEVDTGSPVTIMSKSEFEKIGIWLR